MIGSSITGLVTRFLRYNDLFPPNDVLVKCVRVQRLLVAAKLYRIWLRFINFLSGCLLGNSCLL
jgi:hypothetical protein